MKQNMCVPHGAQTPHREFLKYILYSYERRKGTKNKLVEKKMWKKPNIHNWAWGLKKGNIIKPKEIVSDTKDDIRTVFSISHTEEWEGIKSRHMYPEMFKCMKSDCSEFMFISYLQATDWISIFNFNVETNIVRQIIL